jgi:hypothetical protein
MNEEGPNPSIAAQKFWDAFKTCVEENRVWPISRQGEDRSGR